MRHPAKYTKGLLDIFGKYLDPSSRVLDPFAGTGRVHELPNATVGVEIEPEWAALHPLTLVGDATDLPFEDGSFDAVVTSPTYGNRMVDKHEAKDGSKRNTYTHVLGRKLSTNNSGAMQWGEGYRALHLEAWAEARRVLKKEGVLIVNCKNHIRKGVEIDVNGWHVKTLIEMGFILWAVEPFYTKGNGFGANGSLRTDYEYVNVFKKGII
jgi:tRNA G10  N-methylase Trm11